MGRATEEKKEERAEARKEQQKKKRKGEEMEMEMGSEVAVAAAAVAAAHIEAVEVRVNPCARASTHHPDAVLTVGRDRGVRPRQTEFG